MMREYYALDGLSFDPRRAHESLAWWLTSPAFGEAWLICLDAEVAGYVVPTRF
jgi:hypothetical protein